MADSRVIRKSFIDSDRVNGLGWFAECVYHRLLLVADDFGLYDARPAYLRSQLFGMKLEAVREADLQRALTEVERAGLVRFYTVDGKPYMWLRNYGQRVQSKTSRYPFPEDADFRREYGQVPSVSTVVHGESRWNTVGHGDSPLRRRGEVEVLDVDRGGGEVGACAPACATSAATSTAALSLSDDDRGLLTSDLFTSWLDSLKDAFPPLRRLKTLPADCLAAAVSAFRCVPDAAGMELQPRLKRYYAAAEADVRRSGVKLYRPRGARPIFEALHDLCEYATGFCSWEDKRRDAHLRASRRKAAERCDDDGPDATQEDIDRAFNDALK